jgi:hypothetical protein
MIEIITMPWWELTMSQPFLGLGLLLIFVILSIASMMALTFGITIVLFHDSSWMAFMKGMKMGFVSGLQFQWDAVVIIFTLKRRRL